MMPALAHFLQWFAAAFGRIALGKIAEHSRELLRRDRMQARQLFGKPEGRFAVFRDEKMRGRAFAAEAL